MASIDGEMILCQVKQVQTDKVLNNGVEQIVAAENRFPNANRLALITNAMSITRAQKDLAQQKKVIMICGEDIGNFGLALTKSLSQQ